MRKLRIRRAVMAFLLLTLAYAGLLLWMDQGRGLLNGFDRLYSILPTLMLLSLVSFLVRYARWYWLMARVGSRLAPVRGFVAYLTGFAFTATPGKVGELLRIRYFQPMGLPPALVVAAFVYERAIDLIVVLCMAAVAAEQLGLLKFVVAFAMFVFAIVLVLVIFPDHLVRLASHLEHQHLPWLARYIGMFARGFAHTTVWLKPLDLLVVFLTGLAAWGITAHAFVMLLAHLGETVPTQLAFSIYPAAMLVGAASMLPGGIGSTEAAIIALLVGVGVSLASGTTAAIGIRVATLWFATLLGLVSVWTLELGEHPIIVSDR